MLLVGLSSSNRFPKYTDTTCSYQHLQVNVETAARSIWLFYIVHVRTTATTARRYILKLTIQTTSMGSQVKDQCERRYEPSPHRLYLNLTLRETKSRSQHRPDTTRPNTQPTLNPKSPAIPSWSNNASADPSLHTSQSTNPKSPRPCPSSCASQA